MFATLLIGSVLLATQPSSSPISSEIAPGDRAAYLEASDRAGRDSDANVQLALWCEAHGLEAERLKHLARAVISDPSNAVARGLLGMVAYRGGWKDPKAVAASAGSDEALQATLAEYNARREAMPEQADAHWSLGLWCEEHGLKPEAFAHFTSVTRLDPNRADAWTKLGCRKVGSRWLAEAEIASEQAEARLQKEADALWAPRIKQWWREWLTDKDHREEKQEAFARELQPRAVPTIRTLFDKGTTDQQLVAVQLYDRIDSPEASAELSRFATLDRHPQVRRSAADALTRRDPKEVIEPLITLLRAPITVAVNRQAGPNGVTQLRVEDDRTVLQKTYISIAAPRVQRRVPGNFGFIGPVLGPARTSGRTVQQQLAVDAARIESRNELRREHNESARAVLKEITGQDLGSDPDSWQSWLADQRGYAYVRPTPTEKRQINRTYVGYHHSCFAKGTAVQTFLGLKPIETLRVGDQVLSENATSGALSYQPIVAVYHNPPGPTLRIKLESEQIVATPIHRFWRAGKGWTLARDLKPGDQVRVVGGLVKVAAVEDDVVQPVFNLEISREHSFFVGQQGVLVHDNSTLRSIEPFDAPPELAAVARRPISR